METLKEEPRRLTIEEITAIKTPTDFTVAEDMLFGNYRESEPDYIAQMLVVLRAGQTITIGPNNGIYSVVKVNDLELYATPRQIKVIVLS